MIWHRLSDIMAVYDWIDQNARLTTGGRKIWTAAMKFQDRETCEITLTRQQLAEKTGQHPNSVSEIMSQLNKIGAIYTLRKGSMTVRYFVNLPVITGIFEKPYRPYPE